VSVYGKFTEEIFGSVRIKRMSALMKFEMEPKDKSFLKLAAKVAYGKASDEEKDALATLLKKTPELTEDFTRLQRAVKNEGRRRFWDLALREIFGTASSEEVKELEALTSENPSHRQSYQDAVDFLTAMSSRPKSMKSAKLEPMPPDVQTAIMKSLASRKQRRVL
jgi:hypothetical protein